MPYISRGVARILGKGVLTMRVQILATPTYETERSKFLHRERVLTVASELESRFLT